MHIVAVIYMSCTSAAGVWLSTLLRGQIDWAEDSTRETWPTFRNWHHRGAAICTGADVAGDSCLHIYGSLLLLHLLKYKIKTGA